MRTIIDIPPEDVERLATLSTREGLARAEIIRRAIKLYLESNETPGGDEAFGLWRDQGLDGIEYQSRLRDEWSS